MNIIKTGAAVAELLQTHPDVAKEIRHYFDSNESLAECLGIKEPKKDWRAMLNDLVEKGEVTESEIISYVTWK